MRHKCLGKGPGMAAVCMWVGIKCPGMACEARVDACMCLCEALSWCGKWQRPHGHTECSSSQVLRSLMGCAVGTICQLACGLAEDCSGSVSGLLSYTCRCESKNAEVHVSLWAVPMLGLLTTSSCM